MSRAKKIVLAIVYIVVIIIIFNVGIIVWAKISYDQENAQIMSAISSFIKDLSKQDYNSAYNYLADEAKDNINQQIFSDMVKKMELPLNDSVKNIDLYDWHYSAGKLFGVTPKTMTIYDAQANFVGGEKKLFYGVLYKANGSWKIQSIQFLEVKQLN